MLADGAQIDGLVVNAGSLTLRRSPPRWSTSASPTQATIKTLQLAIGYGAGTLHTRQRLTGGKVAMQTAACTFGVAADDDPDGSPSLAFGGVTEFYSTRNAVGVAQPAAPRAAWCAR